MPVERDPGVDVLDGDAYVVDPFEHGRQSTRPKRARRQRTRSLLGAKDLGQRRDPDLELLGARLFGRQQALDLAPRRVEGARGGGVVVAIAPGEHLDRERGAAQSDHGPGKRPRALDQALQQHRASRREQHHRGDQVGAAAVVLLGHAGRVVDPLLIGGDRLVLDAVVGGEVAVHQGDDGGQRADRLHDTLAQSRGGEPLAHQRRG